jgi:DNA-binding CsgD family transcriptional regulator
MSKPIREDFGTDFPTDAWEVEELSSIEDLSSIAELTSPSESGPFIVRSNSRPTLRPVSEIVTSTEPPPGIPRDVLLALTYGLELVRCGAMLVKGEGQPHFINRSAWETLRKRDGLALARTGLVAERASDTRLLRQLLKDAIFTPENGEPQGSPLTLPRNKARTSLIVRVLPGPGLECWSEQEENRAALLTIYDEENSVQVDEAVLRKLYGLTRGEAALAVVLLKGKSIEDAAAELFISPHTARTHLKRIFMKTDTHRQTELVVRIFSALS